MLKLLALSLMLMLSSVASDRYEVVNLLGNSHGALEFKTLALYKFKGIPELEQLQSDEKREIFHYEQSIVIRDSVKDDGKYRRCEIFEVYKSDEAKVVLSELRQKLNLDWKEVSMDEMMNLLKGCDAIDDNFVPSTPQPSWPEYGEETTDPSTPEENPIFNGIIPGILVLVDESKQVDCIIKTSNRYCSVAGTNWCGFGDIAESYHDLSGLRNVDRCCRSHDLCPIKVLAKDTAYNLTNKAVYTKSHCRCDENLYDCLKKDNGWSAKLIGNLYFYVARPECVQGIPEKSEEGAMKFVPATRKW